MADACRATREAVMELEAEGEMGCPLCERSSEAHRPEAPASALDAVARDTRGGAEQ